MKTVLVGLVFVSILLGVWWFAAVEPPDLAPAGPAVIPPAAKAPEAQPEAYSLPEQAAAPRAMEAREREPAVESVTATRTTRLEAGHTQVLRDEGGNPIGGLITSADGSIQLTTTASIEIGSYLNDTGISTGRYEFTVNNERMLVRLAPHRRPEGLNTSYHAGGEKSSEGWIQDGKRVGPWAEWHANGKRKSEGEYYYGEQHGFLTTWYAGGQRESAGEYLYGKQEGHWSTWYEDGGQKARTEYRNGKYESSASTWHRGGELASEGVWRDGKQHGRWSNYHPSGELESRGEYSYGQREGTWVFYDEEGNLEGDLSGTYQAGVKQDS